MALVRFSASIDSIVGNVGGGIFTNSPYGPMLKRHGWRPGKCERKFWAAYDADPYEGSVTDFDIAEFCAEKGYKSRLWGTLTSQEQVSWETAASQMTWYNRLGDPYTPSGYLLWMRCSMNLQRTGTVPPSTAPSFQGQPMNYDIGVAQDQSGNLLATINTLGNLDEYYVCIYIYDKWPGFGVGDYLPNKFPSAKQIRRNSTLWAKWAPTQAQQTFDITAYFTARYGSIPFGYSLLLRYEFITKTTGMRFMGVSSYMPLVAPQA